MDAVVSTTNGKLRGLAFDGGWQFRGIPYAAPPLAELRFKAPARLVPWQGTRDAHHSDAGNAGKTCGGLIF